MDIGEIYAMSEDELNRAVAIHVMGLKEGVDFGAWPEHDWNPEPLPCDELGHGGRNCTRCGYECCEHEGDHNEPDTGCVRYVPAYTAGPYSSQKVLKAIHARGGYDISMWWYAEGDTDFQCMIDGRDDDKPHALLVGDTMALAVCRAALSVVLREAEA